MGNYAANTKLDQLTLVDGPDMAAPPAAAAVPPAAELPPAAAAAPPAAEISPAMTLELAAAAIAPAPSAPAPAPAPVAPEPPLTLVGTGDEAFMAEAIREYDKGKVEQPLWVRSLAQANGDVLAAKPAYLRARAVALRIERRTKRAELAPLREHAARGATAGSERRAASSPRSRAAPAAPGTLDRKRIAIVGGVFVAIAVVVGFFVMRPGSAPPPAPTIAGAVVPSGTPAPATRAGEKKVDAAKGAAMVGEDFARKVQEFKDAGNWNVLVLYAVEWTRKEPASPDAWKELGGGYLRMRQYDDALDATRKAVLMKPNDAQLWQNLGQINIALKQPVPALAAFEKAAELNDRDVTSRVQAGTLNVELGHLPQAKLAYASALAINPLDVEALCGSATVARKEGRTKDAEAVAHQLKSIGAECREPEPAKPAPVAAVSAPAGKKPAPPRGR